MCNNVHIIFTKILRSKQESMLHYTLSELSTTCRSTAFTTEFLHQCNVPLIINTLCLKKKLYPFNFCDNVVGHELILIIFGKNVAREIGNMQSLTCLLLKVQMSYS